MNFLLKSKCDVSCVGSALVVDKSTHLREMLKSTKTRTWSVHTFEIIFQDPGGCQAAITDFD